MTPTPLAAAVVPHAGKIIKNYTTIQNGTLYFVFKLSQSSEIVLQFVFKLSQSSEIVLQSENLHRRIDFSERGLGT